MLNFPISGMSKLLVINLALLSDGTNAGAEPGLSRAAQSANIIFSCNILHSSETADSHQCENIAAIPVQVLLDEKQTIY
jgi:hypothetical protein